MLRQPWSGLGGLRAAAEGGTAYLFKFEQTEKPRIFSSVKGCVNGMETTQGSYWSEIVSR